jgi:hypothetical protein
MFRFSSEAYWFYCIYQQNKTKAAFLNLKYLITLVICLQVLTVVAQTPHYKRLKSVPINGRYMKMDNLGNSYVVNQKNELHKFAPNGRFIQFYNIVGLGNIGFVDVSNPMKVLVYYPRFTTIKILDVTLSDKGTVNLLAHGYDRINALCLSLDNHIWIYDEITFRLKKLNHNLEIIRQSEDLTTLLRMPVRPNFIMEKDNLLFVNDPEIGILVFDIYSTYIKTIPIKGLKEFQKSGDLLIYFDAGRLQTYHIKALQFSEITLPETDSKIIDAKIGNDLLTLLTENELILYSYSIKEK